VSRARAASAAFTALTLLAVRVPADSVPVPPPAWMPAAGLLVVVLLAVTLAAAVRHRRQNRTPAVAEGEEA
jgi:protein-S-isoprenylcysteine O-methyltransferase Ste14